MLLDGDGHSSPPPPMISFSVSEAAPRVEGALALAYKARSELAVTKNALLSTG